MRGRISQPIATLLALILSGVAYTQTEDPPPAEEPLRLDTVERAAVHLVILDVLVVDSQGRTVSDLTVEDFRVHAGGKPVPIDTLDVSCPTGPEPDAESVTHAKKRSPPAAGDVTRNIVLALDYEHIGYEQRAEVFERARDMIRHGTTPQDRVMLVALNGGLRIEQILSADRDEVLGSLRRMEYDVSLYGPNYNHISEFGFVDSMTTLFDVLGTVPGPKAVVLYSSMTDVPLDLQFSEIAAMAAAARCSIYPADVRGLRTYESGLAASSALTSNVAIAPG